MFFNDAEMKFIRGQLARYQRAPSKTVQQRAATLLGAWLISKMLEKERKRK